MEHGARNILTVANSMTNKSTGRFITPWLFGAIVVCGCGDFIGCDFIGCDFIT